MRRGNSEEAEAAYRSALALSGAGFASHYNLIQICIQQGRRADALSALRKAFYQYPERGELRSIVDVIKQIPKDE